MDIPNKISSFNCISSNFAITLSWNGVIDAEGYILYKKNNSDIWQVITNTTLTSFNDTNLDNNVEYCYKIEAFNKCGISDPTEICCTTVCLPPANSPFNVVGTSIGDNTIKVSWSDYYLKEEYTIQRTDDINGVWTTIGTSSDSSYEYLDSGLNTEDCWYYRIISTHCSVNSDPSDPSELICVNCVLCSAPDNFISNPLSANSMRLQWQEPENNGSAPITNYKILRDDVLIDTVEENIFSYTDNGLSRNTQYCYKIYAITSCGDGEQSSFCSTTFDVADCGSVEQSFSWETGNLNEPGYAVYNTNATTYLSESPSGEIDVTDPNISLIQFSDSLLDDILILVKSTETVIQTYDSSSSSSSGRGNVTFTLPYNCIIMANTNGFFANPDRYTNGVLYNRESSKKTFNELAANNIDILNSHVILNGNDALAQGSGQDFADAGFTVLDFDGGIPISVLESKGFITNEVNGQKTFGFKFYHVVAGSGYAYLRNMTCGPTSSSSSSCSTPIAPTLTATKITGGVTLNWTNISQDLNGYIIDRKVDENDWEIGFANTNANIVTYNDGFPSNISTYCYRVRANDCSEGNNSNEVCVDNTCATTCGTCCCEYEITIGSGELSGVYTLKRNSNDCEYNDYTKLPYLASLKIINNKWQLTISNADNIAIWTCPCDECPDINYSDYTIRNYNTA